MAINRSTTSRPAQNGPRCFKSGQKLIDACRAAGLDIPDLPPPLSAEDWPLALVESPSVVRLTYQGGQPEERAFTSHWGAIWFEAIKR